MKRPIEFIRSKDNELFLQKKWWHRLFKVVLWIGMLEFARRMLVELNLHSSPGSDYRIGLLFYSVVWLIIFFLIQFIYYRIVLYVVYGKALPK